ncbi:hypothetical protein PTKIN_Ptkin08bG0173200 [Pterospermum kingtungense]
METKPGPEDKPGFFKVLLGDFSKQLQIPPAFAKFFHGTPLPQEIKLQNSEKRFWQVHQVEIDKKLFFKKGWRDFVKDNVLELGDFVVFNYVRGSMFRCTIFGKNSCEKDVTAEPSKSANFVSGKGRKRKRKTTMNNEQRIEDCMLDREERKTKVSDEDRGNQRGEGRMFDNVKRHGKVSEKNGANPSDSKINDKPVVIKVEETDEEDAISVEIVEEISKLGKKRKRTESKQSVPYTHPTDQEAGGSRVAWSEISVVSEKSRAGGNGVKPTAGNCKQEKVIEKNVQKLSGEEKVWALEKAKQAFKSENPFVTVAMQPSYIGTARNNHHHVNIPLGFVEAYFNKEHNNVLLQIPGGKSWPMKYYVCEQTKQPAKLNSGWRDFALDNHLAVGDICVFELINGTENILRVDIFRNMCSLNDT